MNKTDTERPSQRRTPASDAHAYPLSHPWARHRQDVLECLHVVPEQGLSSHEAQQRLAQYGPNLLTTVIHHSVLGLLLYQFRSLVVLLLLAATVFSFFIGNLTEAIAILVVIVINVALGFGTEWHALHSMAALRALSQIETRVWRDGYIQNLAANLLVPGDIVALESGDIVPADLRMIAGAKLQLDESALTGESIPVSKQHERLAKDQFLVERSNMLFSGTAVVRGAGEGVVVGTGQATELGRIARLVETAQPSATPLERRLAGLARRLVWLTLMIAAFILLASLWSGREVGLSIQVAIALAVAAIPEGLPVVATIALAHGMWRMARRNALIEKLSAVETLGATNIILTDKTGTLTENRMTVSQIAIDSQVLDVSGSGLQILGRFTAGGQNPDSISLQHLDELLRIAALCNNASIVLNGVPEAIETSGDPTEVALLIVAAKRELFREQLLHDLPEVHEEPFDATQKMMATYHQAGDDVLIAVKGAPEVLLEKCSRVYGAGGEHELSQTDKQRWCRQADAFAAKGLRTLALASRRADSIEQPPFEDLMLLGIVGMLDAARAGVKQAIASYQAAGIRVVMVTGDHIDTARTIAINLGLLQAGADPASCIDGRQLDPEHFTDSSSIQRLLNARVIARATPEQKLRLLILFQNAGKVVAMTGDGINDAPALKQADIGIAMGQRGSQVAKEAADMVLLDDEFATIGAAIAHGRAIFANIRKFVVYLLSCNISEVLIVAIATLLGAPLPLLPLQILFLNIVTDVFPALALGVGKGSRILMHRHPRPQQEPILTNRHWLLIMIYGAAISSCVLTAMGIAIYGLKLATKDAVTIAFLTLAFAQLWHVFNMRFDEASPLRNEITQNPWIWSALGLCIGLILAALFIPTLADVLSLNHPGRLGWLLILVMSLLPLIVGRGLRRLANAFARAHKHIQSSRPFTR